MSATCVQPRPKGLDRSRISWMEQYVEVDADGDVVEDVVSSLNVKW